MTGQLQILDGKRAGFLWEARSFPFWVGRAAEVALRLEEPGVWEKHVEFSCVPVEGFKVRVASQALARLNGELFEEAVLRNGDIIDLGGTRIRFWLPPAPLISWRFREWMTWLGVILLAGLEIVVAYWLCQ